MGAEEKLRDLLVELHSTMTAGNDPETILAKIPEVIMQVVKQDEDLTADICLTLGEALFTIGYLKDSLKCLNKGIELDQMNPDLWFFKARILLQNDENEEALDCYEEALEVARGNYERIPNIYYEMGLIYCRFDRYEEAIESYDESLEYRPRFPDVYIAKGKALHNLGRFEEAIECLDKALEINPVDEEAWIAKGCTFGRLGELERAIGCFNEAIGMKPDCLDALLRKKAALIQMGRLEEAAEVSEQLKKFILTRFQ